MLFINSRRIAGDSFFAQIVETARKSEIVLDASVAIPLLCALFHGSVQQRFFVRDTPSSS